MACLYILCLLLAYVVSWCYNKFSIKTQSLLQVYDKCVVLLQKCINRYVRNYMSHHNNYVSHRNNYITHCNNYMTLAESLDRISSNATKSCITSSVSSLVNVYDGMTCQWRIIIYCIPKFHVKGTKCDSLGDCCIADTSDSWMLHQSRSARSACSAWEFPCCITRNPIRASLHHTERYRCMA